MKIKILSSLVILSVVLLASTGCSQNNIARAKYDKRVNTAYSQIKQQRYDTAIAQLEEAQKIADEESYNKSQSVRLMVEAYLGKGNTIEACQLAKTLLDTNSQDPYAMELMGKVCLRETRYADAERYFVDADSRYEQPEDNGRIADLLSLTRGLTEYEKGNPRVALRYFKAIRNVDLQYSVNKMEKEVSLDK